MPVFLYSYEEFVRREVFLIIYYCYKLVVPQLRAIVQYCALR